MCVGPVGRLADDADKLARRVGCFCSQVLLGHEGRLTAERTPVVEGGIVVIVDTLKLLA